MIIELKTAINLGGGVSKTDLDVYVSGNNCGRIYWMPSIYMMKPYNLIMNKEDCGFFSSITEVTEYIYLSTK